MNKQEMIAFIETTSISWSTIVTTVLMDQNHSFNGWYLSADGPSEEECYFTNYYPCGDESGDIISIKDTKFRSVGVYKIQFINPNPVGDEYKSFADYAFYNGKDWEFAHLQGYEIGEIIERVES